MPHPQDGGCCFQATTVLFNPYLLPLLVQKMLRQNDVEDIKHILVGEQTIILFVDSFKTDLELEKISHFFFSSFNPFPSLPSAATDGSKYFQCSNLTFGNETAPLFWGWCEGSFSFFRNNAKISCIFSSRTDEDFSIPHNKRGIVGMANRGRHTNGSQFYITLQPAPWMDTKYVAFG